MLRNSLRSVSALKITGMTSSLVFLISCGGGGGSTDYSYRPVTVSEGGQGEIEVTQGATGPIFTVNGAEVTGLSENVLVNTNALSGSDFSQLQSFAGDDNFLVAEVEGGQVVIAASQFNGFNDSYAVGWIERTTDTVVFIPQSGTASYNGYYAGFLTEARAGTFSDADFIVTGDAQLNIDFNAGTVSGSITDRVAYQKDSGAEQDPITASDDVILSSATFGANGVITGTTTGGDFNLDGLANGANAGTYTAILVADDGEHALGLVQIEQNSGANYPFDGALEIGGFVATAPR